MKVTVRTPDAKTASLKAVILGKEYIDIKRFSVTGTMTNIFDGWSLELPNIERQHRDLLMADPHRWTPITLYHSDPLVQDGAYIPALQGIITHAEHSYGSGPSTIAVSGYDLGKLFDNCGPGSHLPQRQTDWYRIQGHNWPQLINDLVDNSWRLSPGGGPTDWGIKGVRSEFLNRKLKVGLGRIIQVQSYGAKYGQVLPKVQMEPGETAYEVLSRYARLAGYTPQGEGNGSFFSVAADGWVEIFNPDDWADDPPLYSVNMTRDIRNGCLKGGRLVLDGEALANEYTVYGSKILRPNDPNKQDPYNQNAGKFHETVKAAKGQELRVFRRSTWSDAEAYNRGQAHARADWKRRQAEYGAWQMVLEVQGHSLPGAGALSGRNVPLIEGNIMGVFDEFNGLDDRYLIEQVTRSQDPETGTNAQVVLRKRGLLGA